MIGGENHHRVLQLPEVFKRRENLPDLFVDHRDVGQVVGTLAMPAAHRRVRTEGDGVGVTLHVHPPQGLDGLGLGVHFLLRDRQYRQVPVHVRFGIPLDRIVGRMRTRKSDLEKQRLAVHRRSLREPAQRQVADEEVGMQLVLEVHHSYAPRLVSNSGRVRK